MTTKQNAFHILSFNRKKEDESGAAFKFFFKPFRFSKNGILGLVFALGMFSSTSAAAAGIGVDCVYPDTYYVFFPPTTINVGRDAVNGDLIGSWISIAATPTWTCYRISAAYGVIRLGVSAYSPYTRSGYMTVDGITYGIYTSAVKVGLSYIIRWRVTYNGQTSDWQAVTTAAGVWETPATLFGPIEYDNQTRFPLNVEIQVHFVKTGNLTAGNVAAFDPMYLRPHRTLNNGGTINAGPYRIADYKVNDLKIAAGGTCTTPNVSVQLPTVPANAFTGIGSVAGATPFNLRFNNCPAGLKSIDYSFSPTTSILDASKGVFALSSTSTASGIGLQITTSEDEPVIFGNIYNLADYNSLTSDSYTVVLKANMYQISNAVSPGTVKGAVTFSMDYQ